MNIALKSGMQTFGKVGFYIILMEAYHAQYVNVLFNI